MLKWEQARSGSVAGWLDGRWAIHALDGSPKPTRKTSRDSEGPAGAAARARVINAEPAERAARAATAPAEEEVPQRQSRPRKAGRSGRSDQMGSRGLGRGRTLQALFGGGSRNAHNWKESLSRTLKVSAFLIK